MAKIIYKEGCEGQNKLECIEGLEIELNNGYKALVYPKYKELPLLDIERIEEWKASELTGFQALRIVDGKELTDELLKLDSPAAKFVRQFKSHRYGDFDLPPLNVAAEIVTHKKAIDALAETIKGADLLRDVLFIIWSCCRKSSRNAWLARSYFGIFVSYYLFYKFSVVPTKIYK